MCVSLNYDEICETALVPKFPTNQILRMMRYDEFQKFYHDADINSTKDLNWQHMALDPDYLMNSGRFFDHGSGSEIGFFQKIRFLPREISAGGTLDIIRKIRVIPCEFVAKTKDTVGHKSFSASLKKITP